MKKSRLVFALLLSLMLTVTLIPSLSFADSAKTDHNAQAEKQLGDDGFDDDGEIGDSIFSEESDEVDLSPGQEEEFSSFTYDGQSAILIYACLTGCDSQDEDFDPYREEVTVSVYDKTNGEVLETTGLSYEGKVGFYYGPDEDLPETISPNLTEGHEYSLFVKNDSEKTEYEFFFLCDSYEDGFAPKATMYQERTTIKAGENDYYYLECGDIRDTEDDYYSSLVIITEATSDNEDVLYAETDFDCVYILPKQPGGTATVTVKTLDGQTFEATFNVVNGDPELSEDWIEGYRGDKVQLNVLYNNKSVKWSTSKKKVAKVSKTGLVTMVNPGKCTITAKVAGQKLKCKVVVERRMPNFYTALLKVDTETNKRFGVGFANVGEKDLTVYSAKAVYKDGKKKHKKALKLETGKKAVFVPGQEQIIWFKVKKGQITWDPFQEANPYIELYFSYDGKKYKARVCPSEYDSAYKNGKYWYLTYLED